jgi:tripartite-type tricarboxylate transporter receptor subunit TctC
MSRIALHSLVVGLVLFSAGAAAQDWPSKPVRVIVPWPAGGSADILGRVIADRMSNVLRRSFFVENRPGASGTIGSALVATAEPDGYNFVISGIPSHVVAPATNANVGFDPVKDFTHIAYLGGSPLLVVVHASLGAKTLKDLVTLAKDGRDPLGYVSAGVGSLGNLAMEYLARKEQAKFQHIPYKGGSQAISDLVGGHVKIGSLSVTTSEPHIKSGVLIPLAISSKKRIAQYPDLPTFQELGYDELTTTTWWSFSGPAKLPAAIIERLNGEITAALETPDIRKRLDVETIETEKMSPAEFSRFLESEIKKWAPVAKEAMKGAER